MSLSNILITAVPVAGSLATLSWFRFRPAQPKPKSPKPSRRPVPADWVAEAPAVLRPAVAVVCDGAQIDRMLYTLGLGDPVKGYPLIQGWDYDRHGLHAYFLMLGGQKFDDWNSDSTRDRLATYLGVEQVTVTSPAPSWVRLQVRVHDTLADSATLPTPVHNEVDLEALPMGIREDGETWYAQLLYKHWLIAGAMGSGKGSVLWSMIAALGPAIKAGLVDVLLADPKGGMEFGRGEGKLWTRFEWTATGILAMLTEAEADMQERAGRFRQANIRKFVASKEEPFKAILIDEYAALSAFATKEQMQEFARLCGLILTQGRAVGYGVVVALQDPSKETMPNRQLFPVRMGLRLDEPTQNAMVHGQGAKDRGARCDEIPDTTPGVAYVGEDGTRDFIRVRAYWVSDEAIDAIVDMYSIAPEISAPAEDYSDFDPDDLGDDDFGDGAAVAA